MAEKYESSPFDKQKILTIAKELSLLRIKYEQLIQISKTLLAPWPQEQKTVEQTPKDISPSPSVAPPHSAEIERIDKILSKAQKLRVQKSTHSYSKSLQKARSVYSGEKASTSVKKESIPAVDVTMDMTSKAVKPHPPLEPLPTEHFTLQRNGKSLTLPSKYKRIKTIISKFEEQFKVIDDTYPKENEFIASIGEKKTNEEREQNIQLYLQKKELLLLQETFLALTPQELTVTELEDIVKSKVKLESLFQSVDKLSKRKVSLSPSLSSSSSFLLKGFDTGYDLEHMKLSLEKEFLSLCTSHLIPLLQSLHPSDQKYTILVQLIQNIAGLKKTVFISLDNNNTTTK